MMMMMMMTTTTTTTTTVTTEITTAMTTAIATAMTMTLMMTLTMTIMLVMTSMAIVDHNDCTGQELRVHRAMRICHEASGLTERGGNSFRHQTLMRSRFTFGCLKPFKSMFCLGHLV